MKTLVQTPGYPKPIGPFSHVVTAGNLVFVSAQLAKDPATGNMIMDTIEAETKQVLENIKILLQHAEASFSDVVKASIFLTDMNYYEAVNNVYASYVTEPYPARETLQVAALPMHVNIEISVIAVKK